MKKVIILAGALALACAGLVGCKKDDEGPAQKAGQQIDKKMQEANQKIKEQKPGETAGKKFDKAIEKATNGNGSDDHSNN